MKYFNEKNGIYMKEFTWKQIGVEDPSNLTDDIKKCIFVPHVVFNSLNKPIQSRFYKLCLLDTPENVPPKVQNLNKLVLIKVLQSSDWNLIANLQIGSELNLFFSKYTQIFNRTSCMKFISNAKVVTPTIFNTDNTKIDSLAF